MYIDTSALTGSGTQEILGSMRIGNTESIHGIYTILAVLRQVADWIEVTFRAWVEGMVAEQDVDIELPAPG